MIFIWHWQILDNFLSSFVFLNLLFLSVFKIFHVLCFSFRKSLADNISDFLNQFLFTLLFSFLIAFATFTVIFLKILRNLYFIFLLRDLPLLFAFWRPFFSLSSSINCKFPSFKLELKLFFSVSSNIEV